LIHYKSFKAASTLAKLNARYAKDMPDYLDWGIHVMVSQNESGELTIGDSHEYGMTHDPFDKEFINRMVLDYLKKFAAFPNWNLIQSWNGIYPKLTNGIPPSFLLNRRVYFEWTRRCGVTLALVR
jgi:hypothetical protein